MVKMKLGLWMEERYEMTEGGSRYKNQQLFLKKAMERNKSSGGQYYCKLAPVTSSLCSSKNILAGVDRGTCLPRATSGESANYCKSHNERKKRACTNVDLVPVCHCDEENGQEAKASAPDQFQLRLS